LTRMVLVTKSQFQKMKFKSIMRKKDLTMGEETKERAEEMVKEEAEEEEEEEEVVEVAVEVVATEI